MTAIIELLSTDLLSQFPNIINDCKEISSFIGLSMGWHYPLDWAWIVSHVGNVENKWVIDAGAGRGVLQWYMAEQGAHVLSVDRESRACLPFHIRKRYSVEGLRPVDLIDPLKMISPFGNFPSIKEKIKGLALSTAAIFHKRLSNRPKGKVFVYNNDLQNLTEIESNTIDIIISVSALEHNPPNKLPSVVKELERVLKPGGSMAVTLSASKDQDWFHEPSKGWCYTERTIREMFSLSENTVSNYDQYDHLLSELKENSTLRNQLAKVYFRNRNNGMPGGEWDPKYLPVGILKSKIL